MAPLKSVLCFTALLLSQAHNELHATSLYENHRFGFSASVPIELIAAVPPDNDDGLSYYSADGQAKLRLFASGNATGDSLEALISSDRVHCLNYPSEYEVRRQQWAIISCFSPEGIFYHKILQTGRGQEAVFTNVEMIYPISEQTHWDDIVRLIASSVKPAPGLPSGAKQEHSSKLNPQIVRAGVGISSASKLRELFQSETLGVRVAYLESRTGPAMHVYQNAGGLEVRDYKVDGCKVSAGVKASDVRFLRLDLTPRCNFNLGAFLGKGFQSTNGMTIGGFAKGLSGGFRVQSDCVENCGNNAEPVVDFNWEGAHSDNFVNLTLGVTLVNGPSLNGASKWTAAMQKQDGDDYVLHTRFNCDRKWDTAALQYFAAAKVDAVTIGYDLPSADYANHCHEPVQQSAHHDPRQPEGDKAKEVQDDH
jgi:hypothetical protein